MKRLNRLLLRAYLLTVASVRRYISRVTRPVIVNTKGETLKFCSYLRVSSKRQGASGLGLEAQREAVKAYVQRLGGTIAREYVEIESGANADRPKLKEALAFARRSKATLLVARLDRLSRSVAFIAKVLESKVHFAAVDFPEANHLTLHILAAVAEYERKLISVRTRDALRATKARGTRLGTHNPRVPILTQQAARKGAVKGAAANRIQAREAYSDLLRSRRAELRDQGSSFRAIADTLNADGHLTRNDALWSATAVYRVLCRA